MTREFSDELKKIVRGLEKITTPSCASGFALGEKTLLVINAQGKKITGGRMPYKLVLGAVNGRCVVKKRKGEQSGKEGNALRLRVTHSGKENIGLVKREESRKGTYLYENIVSAYRVR